MEKAYWLFNHVSPGGHASPRLPYTVRMSLKATPPVGKPDCGCPGGCGAQAAAFAIESSGTGADIGRGWPHLSHVRCRV